MKFLDFRRYIFANFLSLFAYIDACASFLYANADFPPPVPGSIMGEPALILSAQEEHFKDILFIIMCFIFLFFCLFLIEFLIRILIFLVRKFILKKMYIKTEKKKTNIVKIISAVYTFFFYLGLIYLALLFF